MTHDRVGDDELSAQEGEVLPDREAMTVLHPDGLLGQLGPGVALEPIDAPTGPFDPDGPDAPTTS